MVLLRGLLGEPLERVNAAQSHRQNRAAQHLRSLLVALVQQSLLRRLGLALGSFSLAMRQHPAPDGKHQSQCAGDQKTDIPYRRAVGFHRISVSIGAQPVPYCGWQQDAANHHDGR